MKRFKRLIAFSATLALLAAAFPAGDYSRLFAAVETYTYKVSVLGNYNYDTRSPTLVNLDTGADVLGVRWEVAGYQNVATIASESDKLSLRLDWGQTASEHGSFSAFADRSFALTPDYPNVYLENNTAHTLYVTPRADGGVAVADISSTAGINFKYESYDGDGPYLAEIANAGAVLSALTPTGASPVGLTVSGGGVTGGFTSEGSPYWFRVKAAANGWGWVYGSGSQHNASFVIPSAPETPAGAYAYNVYYYRYAGDYDGWNAWWWVGSADGADSAYFAGSVLDDGWGKVTIRSDSPRIGLQLKKGDWQDREGKLTLSVPSGNYGDFYLWEGYDHADGAKPSTVTRVKMAFAEDPRRIEAVFTDTRVSVPVGSAALTLLDNEDNYIGLTVTAKPDDQAWYPAGTRYTLTADEDLIPNRAYRLFCDANGNDAWDSADEDYLISSSVAMRGILDSFAYDGDDLGAEYAADSTAWKLWAPEAASVWVYVYDGAEYNGEKHTVLQSFMENPDDRFEMEYDEEDNVWEYEYEGDFLGEAGYKYYVYRVERPSGGIAYAPDPYAVSASANGQLSAVVDLSATDAVLDAAPTDYAYNNLTDDILYELHIRDFSINPSSGISVENQGKFRAFTEQGTTVTLGGDTVSTGIDHLKELGVTHIHLLPAFDFGSVDELGDLSYGADGAFNWGYDPQNYMTPEGSYSSDPTDPYARINDFKSMVSALHAAGIKVVMDVVYNHTYDVATGPFDRAVPWYYYRETYAGTYADGSGCGNEAATERAMVRKYIIDSLLYWQSEYKIDGFRFDLMQIIDNETMTEATKALRANDPSVIVYGEPWALGQYVDNRSDSGLDTWKGSQKGKGFAAFNDDYRAAVKGGSDDGSRGFATESGGREVGVVNGVKGIGYKEDGSYIWTLNPTETVNYVTAHDNLNLWDKIALTFGKGDTRPAAGAAFSDDTNDIKAVTAVSVLTSGMILTSQGIPFFQAGDEFLRTKNGEHNSYNLNDTVNAIDWEDKVRYADVTEYYKGLIKLRKEHPAFRMDDADTVNSKVAILQESDGVVAFRIGEYANGDTWKNIYVAYNGGASAKTVNFGVSGLRVVANQYWAGTGVIGVPTGTASYGLAAHSMVVLYDSEMPRATSKLIIELDDDGYAGPRDLSGADVWVWKDGGIGQAYAFSQTIDGHRAAVIEAESGAAYGYIVRQGGYFDNTNVNNWINGFADTVSPQDLDRFVATSVYEPTTKVVIKIRELPPEKIYPEALSYIDLTSPDADDAVFLYRDQDAFRAGDPELAAVPSVRYRPAGSGDAWNEPAVLEYDAADQVYKAIAPDAAKDGDIEYEFSPGGGAAWASDTLNLTADGKSVLAALSAYFAHEAFNSEQLNALIVKGAFGAAGVTADLSAFGLSAAEPVPELTRGRFAKVVAGSAAGDKSVIVKITVPGLADPITRAASTNFAEGSAPGFDWDEARIYFLLTDRFSKDGGLTGTATDTHTTGAVSDADGRALAKYHGGDLAGVTAKLDYLKNLGINTIWITPVVDNIDIDVPPADGVTDFNQSYHGYWAEDFTKLDPRLGTEEDLTALAEGAHARGMKLMVDIVLNHAGYETKLNENFRLDDGRSMFRAQSESGDVRSESEGLPDFKTEDIDVRAKLVAWQSYWAEKYGIDYFRVDTVKHVEPDTWEALKSALVAENPDFKMIGEYYGAGYIAPGDSSDGHETWSQGTPPEYWNIGALDSLLDFDFKYLALHFAQDNSDISWLSAQIQAREAFLDANPGLTLGQFLSSHDERGFGTRLTGTDAEKEKKLTAAAAFQITAKGQPVVYYGEELGQYGAKEAAYGSSKITWYNPNRYDFDWTKAEALSEPALLAHYRALLNSRAEFSRAFSKGERTYHDGLNANVLVFSAVDAPSGQKALTLVNRGDQAQSVSVPVGAVWNPGTELTDFYAKLRDGSDVTATVSAGGNITVTVPAVSDGGAAVFGEYSEKPVLTHPSAGRMLTELTVTNKTGTNADIKVFVAVYGADRLISLKTQTETVNAGGSAGFSVETPLDDAVIDKVFAGDGYYAAVYVWDADTYAPLRKKYVFPR